MKDFFRGVRRHIDKLDAGHLREQYLLMSKELESVDKLLDAIDRGIVVLDADGAVTRFNPAAETLQRLEHFGCTVYRTDRDGTITIRR